MQYIELNEFEDFIKSRNLVEEKYRSYYVGWVRRFLQSDFTVDELSGRDQVVCFSDQLERDKSVSSIRPSRAAAMRWLFLAREAIT